MPSEGFGQLSIFVHFFIHYMIIWSNDSLTKQRFNFLKPVEPAADLPRFHGSRRVPATFLVTATTTLFHMDQTLVALQAPKRKRRKKRTALREYMRMFISVYMYIYIYCIYLCVSMFIYVYDICVLSMYFFICLFNHLSIHVYL